MITLELSRADGDYGFDVKDANGHIVRTDSNPESGGRNYGLRPMQLLLAGLASCAGIDVVGILKKQKQDIKDLKIKVSGEREANIEPSLWKKIQLEFHFYGAVDEDKAKRSAELSINKYCSVAATLKAAGADIQWQVFVHAAQ
jgi:putative redox protein